MSKFFQLPEEGIGPGGTWYFRKHTYYDNWYYFYVGDERLGEVMSTRKGEWSGLSHNDYSEFFGVRMIEGFSSRYHAAVFILQHHGYRMRDQRRWKKQNEEIDRKYGLSV